MVLSGEVGVIRDSLGEVSLELGSKCTGNNSGKGQEEQAIWGGRAAGPLWRWFLLKFFLKKYLFIYYFIYLFWLHWVFVAASGLLSCGMRTFSCGMHVGSSFPTRDQTRAPCIGSMESYPLDHQGSLWRLFLMLIQDAGD